MKDIKKLVTETRKKHGKNKTRLNNCDKQI